MRIGNLIFQFFKAPDKPIVNRLIQYAELKKLLQSKLPKGCFLEILDTKYSLTNKNELVRILEYSAYKSRPWIADKYDCDNFAFGLKALVDDISDSQAFGLVGVVRADGTRHALNLFVDKDLNLWYVEPQTSEVFAFGGAKAITQGYKPYLVVL